MIVQPPHTATPKVMSLFLKLPKWCFHPDPLPHFGSMSLNMKCFFLRRPLDDFRELSFIVHLIHIKISGGYDKPVPHLPAHWVVLDPNGDFLGGGWAEGLCQPRPGKLLLTMDLEAAPSLHCETLGVVAHARVRPNLPSEGNLGLSIEGAALRPDDQAAILPDDYVVSSDASLFVGIEN